MISDDFYTVARPRPGTRRVPDDLARWFDSGAEILDVGAGPCAIAADIARDGYRVWALEPDSVSRALGVELLAADALLRQRVSVVPLPLGEAPLPDRLGGAVASHVLFLVDRATRLLLWDELAARLTPTASALVSRAWPTLSEPVERRLWGAEPLGRLELRRWFSSEKLGDGRMRYVNDYDVCDGETVISTQHLVSELLPLSEEEVVAEAGERFSVTTVDDDWLAFRLG